MGLPAVVGKANPNPNPNPTLRLSPNPYPEQVGLTAVVGKPTWKNNSWSEPLHCERAVRARARARARPRARARARGRIRVGVNLRDEAERLCALFAIRLAVVGR